MSKRKTKDKEIITHQEACELIEQAVSCSLSELIYIRERRRECSASGLGVRERVALDKAVSVTDINSYGAYLKGARAMYRALECRGFLVQPKSEAVVNRAMLSAYMSSTRNMEWLLEGLPQGVELYTEIERDKKGRIKGAKSKFITKETITKEI